jgi:hypothetical protein
MEGIPDAYQAEQIEGASPRALRSYLEEIITRLPDEE